MSIKSLNTDTIRLIKTTQVISSVSSAVKELVENALDANARNIEINLVDNGLTLIEVKDDGSGIDDQNSMLMGLPAYTSKIKEFKDLESLKTYGFRGEALNAICQVADVSVSTKIENEKAARLYKLNHDGTINNTDFTHRTVGTTVQMRNLLKNFPVRRNIISNTRKQMQEIKTVETLLKCYSICQYSIRFNLRVNNKIIFTKSSCKGITEALNSVLGSKVVNNMTSIQRNISQAEINLIIPKKEVMDPADVSQSGHQFITVNNRPIKSKEFSKILSKRISDNFKQTTSLKFVYFMSIVTDPTLVDVNLEPNKDIVILQYKDEILEELDGILINFYGISNSQSSIGSTQLSCTDKRIQITDSETEWPACKKLRLSAGMESICDITKTEANSSAVKKFQTENLSQSDCEFINQVKNPELSDPDSNDAEEFLKRNKTLNGDCQNLTKNAPESELFDFCENLKNSDNIKDQETLSQLPKVDLGEDIDWVVVKKNVAQIKSEDTNLSNIEETGDNLPTLKEARADLMAWSRGKVPGVKCGVTLEPPKFEPPITSVQRVTNGRTNEEPTHDSELLDFCSDLPNVADEISSEVPIVDLGDDLEWQTVQPASTTKMTPKKKMDRSINKPSSAKKMSRCSTPIPGQTNLSSWRMGESPIQSKPKFSEPQKNLDFLMNDEEDSVPIRGFSLFCREVRPQLIKDNPSLSIAAVANILSSRWKSMSSEERGYFRDRATDNKPLPTEMPPVKVEDEKKDEEHKKKELVKMLQSMKTKRRDMKEGNMLTRTSYPLEINMSLLTEKFKRNNSNQPKAECFVIGSIYPTIWVINYNLKFHIVNVKDFFELLEDPELDFNKVTADLLENRLRKWISEKGDSLLHPFYTQIEETNQQN